MALKAPRQAMAPGAAIMAPRIGQLALIEPLLVPILTPGLMMLLSVMMIPKTTATTNDFG